MDRDEVEAINTQKKQNKTKEPGHLDRPRLVSKGIIIGKKYAFVLQDTAGNPGRDGGGGGGRTIFPTQVANLGVGLGSSGGFLS